MNSLFSYELDEKKIRTTLQNAEMEYNDAYWFDFDSSFSERQVKKTSSTPAFIKFNLNINRNILLPVFFIIALAGVSAIMYRFVDLKPGKNQPAEKALIPNAANYKVEKKAVVPAPKKEIPKLVPPVVKKDSVIIVKTVPPPVVTPTVVIQDQSIAKNSINAPVQKPDSSSVTASLQSAENNSITPVKKKRRRNRTADPIDVIKAPIILSSNSTPEIEPELKIK